MKSYRDGRTGYEVWQYTFGPERNAKLYFTTENFSADDRYFFFTRECVDGSTGAQPGLYRAHVETGEMTLLADARHSGFAMHWNENYGVIARDDGGVLRLDLQTGAQTLLGWLPKGAKPQGHLTIANDGCIACSAQLQNKIYALLLLRPGQEQAQVVYRTDQWISHAQICPTDSSLIFYVHETGGDALQRTWMFEVKNHSTRPYYVEHEDEWITHETWSADGSVMVFMRIPYQIMLGDKDGRHFDVVYETDMRVLHPGISRDKQWLCTDAMGEESDGVYRVSVRLINVQTGRAQTLAYTCNFRTGQDHLHPSFNRAGDKVLFSAPDENGVAQICLIDLAQVKRP